MCGIAGRFNFKSGAPVDPNVVRSMCDLIAHRGPDGEDVFARGPIGLGHRRLAIIDLSDAGRQPMSTADGRYWITFNGEIYNFLQLRAEFEKRGHQFRSRTDTEVILAAYREFGVDCLGHLRGMFAFAIWDANDRTLFLARDRVGKKPLYYRLDGDGIAFASEPKAFLAEPGFEPRPNLDAIAHYLTYHYIASPHSAFEGVARVRPGHYLLVTDATVATKRYWRLPYQPKRQLSVEDARERLLSELQEATRLRLISDVPLGAFLSGGVDSGTVVALMAEQSSAPVKTFTIGFDEADFNEVEYARLVARRYNTDHHEFVVRPDATEIFSKLVWHYNEPFADSSAIPSYYLSQLTRQHVTVALNGDGADESFAGYRRYVVPPSFRMYSRLPEAARRALAAAASMLPGEPGSREPGARVRRWVRRNSLPVDRWNAANRMYFDDELKARVWTPEFARAAEGARSDEIFLDESSRSGSSDVLDVMLNADVNWYLTDALLVKIDIATMAHGLEGRSPFLDHHVMEFAASLPSDMKVHDGTTKYLLKQTVRHLLPPEIIDRPKKGFSVPLRHWFRHELKALAYDVLLDSRAASRGYFRPAAVRQMLDEHVSGARNNQENIWILLMLELWHRTFIDGGCRAANGSIGSGVGANGRPRDIDAGAIREQVPARLS
jgi:asparagine synthase (glutamine-hydrolysing)